MKKKLNLYESINDILALWNPINVPKGIASDEYREFVPQILHALQKKGDLIACLEGILQNGLGLEYDSNNNEQKTDMKRVSKKLLTLWELVCNNE